MNLASWSILILLFAPVFFCLNLFLCRVGTIAGLTCLTSHNKPSKLHLPQFLFAAWLIWAAIGCFLSEYPMIAIEGYFLRTEGIITWITFASVAYLTKRSDSNMNKIGVLLGVICMILFFAKTIFYHDQRFDAYVSTAVALGSFSACAFVYAWTYYFPSASGFILGSLIIATNRTAIIAVVVGLACYYILTNRLRLAYKPFLYVLGALIIIIPFTPLYGKIKRANFSLTGSRSQWILQADHHVKALPLFGYGLDTIGKYINAAKGETREKHAIADRVHFLPLDICLQTGWIGLTLFLLCFGSAIGYAVKYPSHINAACASVMVTWFAFGCFNPQGLQSMLLMLFCLFQIGKPNDDL